MNRPPRSTRLHRLAVCLAACLPAATLACGPDFPTRVLEQREAHLLQMPDEGFAFDVQRLVPAPDPALPVHEDAWLAEPHSPQLAHEKALREAALARGETPVEADILAYQRGAAAWHAGEIAAAAAAFDELLQWPPEQRPQRSVMARYMLGRSQAQLGDAAAAAASFQQLRREVQGGAADPLGLGSASLGEEARLALDAGDAEQAVSLYAQQAALGSASGRDSLRQVAAAAVDDAEQRARLLQGPLGQRLLLSYLFAHNGALPADLAAALPSDHPERDRLAALAYNAGDYTQAQALATGPDTPLAHWLQAKLALRRGDSDAAMAAYARAVDGFPVDPQRNDLLSSDPTTFAALGSDGLTTHCRMRAEAGTLALSRGDFVEALAQLYVGAGLYWSDVAYIAERVLTVDELRQFVDQRLPTIAVADVSVGWAGEDPPASLRALLARRLLREGRGSEALPYFSDETVRAQAAEYMDARAAMQRGSELDRARAAFAAAELARWQGMELLGYELDPDYGEYAGMFDLNSADGWNYQTQRYEMRERADIHIDPSFSSEAERQRVQASRAEPLQRFHYRGLAANLAEQAASLLPPRSQAYAAVMCQAVHYVMDRDPARRDQLYLRYLREGAYVPWGGNFGRDCPAPDFDKVAREQHAARMAMLQRAATWTLPPLLLLGAGALLWRRRRSGVSPTSPPIPNNRKKEDS